MRIKCLSVAMAVAMMAACLAGCSKTPAGESVTDIENTTAAESSVTETESSVVMTEVQAEKDVLDAAKAYGMTQVKDQQEIMNLWGGFDSASVYYIAKDSNEASSMYSSLFNLDAKTFPRNVHR